MSFFFGASPGAEEEKDERSATEKASPRVSSLLASASETPGMPEDDPRGMSSLSGLSSFLPAAFSLPWKLSPERPGEEATYNRERDAFCEASQPPEPSSDHAYLSWPPLSHIDLHASSPSLRSCADTRKGREGRNATGCEDRKRQDRREVNSTSVAKLELCGVPRRPSHRRSADALYRHQGVLGDCDPVVAPDFPSEDVGTSPSSALRQSSEVSRERQACVEDCALSGLSACSPASTVARKTQEKTEGQSVEWRKTEKREAGDESCDTGAQEAGEDEGQVGEETESGPEDAEDTCAPTERCERRQGESLHAFSAGQAKKEEELKPRNEGDRRKGVFRVTSLEGEWTPTERLAPQTTLSSGFVPPRSPLCSSSSCSLSPSHCSLAMSSDRAEKQDEEEYDRYGFRVNAPERLRLKLREYSFKIQHETEERDNRWAEFVKRDPSVSDRRTLKRLVRRGIPDSLRQEIWARCLGSWTLREQHPTVFEEMTRKPVPQDVVEQIELDLLRTFPTNRRFRGKAGGVADLRQVLWAFAAYKPKINYCQSMNFLAATLLLFMPPDVAFWSLVQLIDSDVGGKGMKLAGYYTSGMAALRRDLKVLAILLKKKLPRVAQTLRRTQVGVDCLCAELFLSLYSSSVPIYTTFRIWDSLVLEGQKILFRIALAIFFMHEREIAALTSLEEVMTFWRGMIRHLVHRNELMTVAFTRIGRLSRRELSRLQVRMMHAVEAENRAYEARRSLHAPPDSSSVFPRQKAPLEGASPERQRLFFSLPWRRWSRLVEGDSPHTLASPLRRRGPKRTSSDGDPSPAKKRQNVPSAEETHALRRRRFFHAKSESDVAGTPERGPEETHARPRRGRWSVLRPASAEKGETGDRVKRGSEVFGFRRRRSAG
ncbi:TBC domain-containing protein [Toxoplasma gondii MAS]|uniref:TBC domain-containing protein n=1 Tax=Toxoplasma gondii MAS TaxID=943118 RepID=A0A086QRU1_TOXGO|nr:TBC domain-containing protein [Toxoplasma gondii MAS]